METHWNEDSQQNSHEYVSSEQKEKDLTYPIYSEKAEGGTVELSRCQSGYIIHVKTDKRSKYDENTSTEFICNNYQCLDNFWTLDEMILNMESAEVYRSTLPNVMDSDDNQEDEITKQFAQEKAKKRIITSVSKF